MTAVISKELRNELLAVARKKQDRVKTMAAGLYMDRIQRRRNLSDEQVARLRERGRRTAFPVMENGGPRPGRPPSAA